MGKLESFLLGMVSIIPFIGMYFIYDKEIRERQNFRERLRKYHRTDAEALASDWQMVGKDIQTAINKYKQEKT
jgi:hypothetical protein